MHCDFAHTTDETLKCLSQLPALVVFFPTKEYVTLVQFIPQTSPTERFCYKETLILGILIQTRMSEKLEITLVFHKLFARDIS